jgi:hypothetical protein
MKLATDSGLSDEARELLEAEVREVVIARVAPRPTEATQVVPDQAEASPAVAGSRP